MTRPYSPPAHLNCNICGRNYPPSRITHFAIRWTGITWFEAICYDCFTWARENLSNLVVRL